MKRLDEERIMKQIRITRSENEANKVVIELMQRQDKIVAMRPFVYNEPDPNTSSSYLMKVGIAIEYEMIGILKEKPI